MTRLATSFVLAYHGCDKRTADRAIRGDIDLIHSENDIDWLGPGAYFWESDPVRALEWAEARVKRGEFKTASVIGAAIDLRNCLDLVSRQDLRLVKAAYESFVAQQRKAGLPIPKNKKTKREPDFDRLLRSLDCAVIKHLHAAIDAVPPELRTIQPFDTVRGMFTEGKKLYPGCGFREKSHVQIAVRNNACIKGLFYPRDDLL